MALHLSAMGILVAAFKNLNVDFVVYVQVLKS